MTDTHAELIDRIAAWARADDNIRAVVMTGSATRGAGQTDRFSDRDIEIIARDRQPLLDDDGWIHAIAPVWVALYLDNDAAFDTRLVFFEGGRKVDLTIADASRFEAMVTAGHLDGLYTRGYRVLLDKDGITAPLTGLEAPSPERNVPTAEAFAETVTEFWFEAAHMPTYLSRDEPWVVKVRDWTMKQMLLRMLEWHAMAMGGPETDVWHIGTKMERWVDGETWEELLQVFGRFDRADSWRALVAMMALFTRLTRETAQALGMDYPADAERAITGYVLSAESSIGGSG